MGIVPLSRKVSLLIDQEKIRIFILVETSVYQSFCATDAQMPRILITVLILAVALGFSAQGESSMKNLLHRRYRASDFRRQNQGEAAAGASEQNWERKGGYNGIATIQQ